MHDNTISGTWGNNVWQFGDSSGRPNGSWGAIDGSKAWDGNCQAGGSANNANVTTANGFPWNCGAAGAQYPVGYPSIGQPGWAQLSSTTPSLVQSQSYEPIRIWSNSIGSLTAHSLTTNQSSYIALGRDVFYSIDASAAKAGYTPYTYPHPLQTGGPIVQIRPAAPIIVQIQ